MHEFKASAAKQVDIWACSIRGVCDLFIDATARFEMSRTDHGVACAPPDAEAWGKCAQKQEDAKLKMSPPPPWPGANQAVEG